MELAEFLTSERYVKRQGADTIYMPHPQEVVDAFRQTTDQVIEVKAGQPVTVQELSGQEHTTFREYILSSKVQGYDMLGHEANIGVLVNLNKDIMIVYAGWEATICTNLCTFGASEDLRSNSVNVPELRTMADRAISGIGDQSKVFKATVERLMNNTFPNEVDFYRRMGEVLMNGGGNGTVWSYMKHAEEQFRDPESIYYNWENTDWKLLSGMTDRVKNQRASSQIAHTKQLEALFV